ncbi:MAG: LysM peptidoglycan-binding domain-containing protein [Anaerolineaceae bacterium]|nr:LysM peptidoglycan-binding domain-containing protein [Anaerolineaceae bacterium]
MKQKFFLLLLLPLALLIACNATPTTVEVTRLVTEQVEVPVEVTRIVTETNTVELPVEVEVTRLVEVMVTPTEAAEAVEETAVEATAVPPTPTPENATYTVQSGDNISFIAAKTGVPAADILAANGLTTSSFLDIGQELIIPGWNGEIVAVIPQPANPEAPAAPSGNETAALTPVGPNLLPNPSFEEDWYFFQGVSEWQIPNGWLLAVDEGQNTLEGGSGGTFLRPEIRVVPSTDIPPSERASFIFDGQKTIKAFKGGAPTNFAIFTDVTLPPGQYRLSINFFPDIIGMYDGGNKVWSTLALSSEARVIVNDGGTGWVSPQPGTRATLTYDFTVEATGQVRVGAAFRSRHVNNNNGWFLDAWSLQALGNP